MRAYHWGLIGGLLLCLGVWKREALFPSEATRVRSALLQLASDASFGPSEGNIGAVRRVASVADRFVPNATIEVDILGSGNFQLNGRDEVQQHLMAARRFVRKLVVQFHDIVVEVADDGATASAHLTATADAVGEGRYQGGFDALEFEVSLKKLEGRWQVERLRTVPTLKQ